MNITNLILQLKSKITDNPLDQQAISKAIKLLEVGVVFTASSVANLPSVSLNVGKLYYVEFDGLYFSDGLNWKPLVTPPVLSNLWAWGSNGSGRLGDGTATDKSSPVSVAGGFTDWCQVSTGFQHTGAVRANGSLWMWGFGANGRLGDNVTAQRSSPVLVAGGFTDWCQVSAGSNSSAAVRMNGTLWTWGSNCLGQLGHNTATTCSRLSPVQVVGGFTNWCQVSTGLHTAAVRTNGTLWAWGFNGNGQLGDNTITSKLSPVQVVGGFTNWCQVSTNLHTAAVRTNGSLWAWGGNNYGRLGDGTTISRSSPVAVVGGFTDWCQVAAGRNHTAAVRTNGSLWAWGGNGSGQLGDNTTVGKSSPVSVVGGFTDWCQVAAGNYHTAAVRSNGTLWAWGDNGCGRLGHNTATTCSRSSPVSVVGRFADWCQVSVGSIQTLAIRQIQS